MRFMMFMYPEIEEKDWGPKSDNVEEFEAMGRYNEELRKAGMLLSLDGLQPPSEGGVVYISDGKATITATVEGHERGKKIRIVKFKPKRGYKRTAGHRQELTRLRVTGIEKGS